MLIFVSSINQSNTLNGIFFFFSLRTLLIFLTNQCLFQGKRVSQDLNIRKETGGVSSPVVQLEFNAQVTENYLEIHLFWAGKGTCCIPVQGTYGPSISAIRATPGIVVCRIAITHVHLPCY